MNENTRKIRKLVYSAICLALCMVLPFFTGHIPQIGKMISPMHIPVFLCGMLCGFGWGAAVGFIAPLLRSVVFGMPALFPGGVAMAFELATYGFLSGILYSLFPKKTVYIYVNLIISMICGRIIVQTDLTVAMFVAGGVTNAIPGIILHLILIPIIVVAMERAGLVLNG